MTTYQGGKMENKKEHYKLYKSGKIWITAAVVSGMFAITNVSSVQADIQEAQPKEKQVVNSLTNTTNQELKKEDNNLKGRNEQKTVADNTVYNEVAKHVQDKENVDLNSVANHNVLGLASNFGIYAKDANLSADTNSNLAVKTLHNASSQDFGTRGKNPDNLTQEDITYIQNISNGAIKDNAFRNPNGNTVVVGQTVKVEKNNDSVRINGTQNAITNLKSKDVIQDTDTSKFIDFDESFTHLQSTAQELAQYSNSVGVVTNYSDMNNRNIDISNAKADDRNRIFVDVPFEYLQAPQPLKISGLSSLVTGSTIILNVKELPKNNQNIQTQVKLSYTNGAQDVANSESHSVPNHLLWNFGLSDDTLNFTSGRFMGSILAPNAIVKAGVNIDGNIVAKSVQITGGEFHRWDLQSSITPNSETPSSEVPSSEVPNSETPSSEVPSSETPSSETPSSEVPSSEVPSSETPSSEVPSSEVPSSETPSSEVPSSEVPSSEVPSSEVPSSETPSSEVPSSEVPSSETPSSEIPSSEVPSSETPSSEVPSSEVPSSETPSSEVPSSEVPSSETPSSETPSSETPSSEVPSSEVPSSEVPSSEKGIHNSTKLPRTDAKKGDNNTSVALMSLATLGISGIVIKRRKK